AVRHRGGALWPADRHRLYHRAAVAGSHPDAVRAESATPVASRSWLATARSLAALAAIVCIYNLPQLGNGTVQYDGLDVHYSAQRYLSDELHAGRVPFWTAYVFSGFPFLADVQVGAWYPLNWPFFAAGITPRSMGGELLVSGLVACSGAYALA